MDKINVFLVVIAIILLVVQAVHVKQIKELRQGVERGDEKLEEIQERMNNITYTSDGNDVLILNSTITALEGVWAEIQLIEGAMLNHLEEHAREVYR